MRNRFWEQRDCVFVKRFEDGNKIATAPDAAAAIPPTANATALATAAAATATHPILLLHVLLMLLLHK